MSEDNEAPKEDEGCPPVKKTRVDLTKPGVAKTKPSSANSILVNSKQVRQFVLHFELFLNINIILLCQKGNPLLKFVKNVPWEYSDIVPDYVMGPTACALFLSLRYHQLNPDYIHDRLKLLGTAYQLRVLLVQVISTDFSYYLKFYCLNNFVL